MTPLDDSVLAAIERRQAQDAFRVANAPENETLDLKAIGCSDSEHDNVTIAAARGFRPPQPGDPVWNQAFSGVLGLGLLISIVASLAVYGIVRAIGWVIGGFAAP